LLTLLWKYSALLYHAINYNYFLAFFLCASTKGYMLTKQGKSIIKMGWRLVTSETEEQKMSSDMTNTDTDIPKNFDPSSVSPEHLLFAREVGRFPFPFFLFSWNTHIVVAPNRSVFCLSMMCLDCLKPEHRMQAFSFVNFWISSDHVNLYGIPKWSYLDEHFVVLHRRKMMWSLIFCRWEVPYLVTMIQTTDVCRKDMWVI